MMASLIAGRDAGSHHADVQWNRPYPLCRDILPTYSSGCPGDGGEGDGAVVSSRCALFAWREQMPGEVGLREAL